jgi:hypothetical protein
MRIKEDTPMPEEDFQPSDSIDPLYNPTGNAYGFNGYGAGIVGHSLLDDLSEPLLESERDERGWYYPEGGALAALSEFDGQVPNIRAGGEVSLEEMEAFTARLDAFRLALPLSEAERHWMHRVEGAIDPHSYHFEAQIGHVDDEVIALGLRTRIDGRDMLRRWRAWRRETDEYAGQGTLDLAREALRGVVQLLLPDEILPRSYRQLRGLPTDFPEDRYQDALRDWLRRCPADGTGVEWAREHPFEWDEGDEED